jgi:hypothetical protein
VEQVFKSKEKIMKSKLMVLVEEMPQHEREGLPLDKLIEKIYKQ